MTSPFGSPAQDDTGKGKKFNIDLTNIEYAFNIDPGMYPAKIIKVEEQVSKSSGNDMIVFTFAIIGGKYSGKEFKNFCSLTPSALWKLAEVLDALGLAGTGSVAEFEEKDVMNKAAVLEIADSEYNGKTRSSINIVHAHPDGPDVFKNTLPA